MSAFTWTDLEVRRALGLRTDLARGGVVYSEVSTDSRTLRPGALYVALTGDRFDGHDFVADAVAGGALGVVVSRALPEARDVTVYPVEDTLEALGALGAHRRGLLDCPVVAITGSSGKTTTKDFLSAALGGALRTYATRGNRNNRVGVPLTLLDVPDDAEAVVLEIGTSEPGEIRALTAIARPDVAVITTVGESHLEGLGSFEGVLEEKTDLVRGLRTGARAVVGDEPVELATVARSIRPDVKVAGTTDRADADLRPEAVEVDPHGGYRFGWRGQRVSLPVPGRHAVTDALLALAVSEMLGVPARSAVEGLQRARTADMRGEVRNVGGLTVIVDCYNANPQSVRAALELLERFEAPAGRVAVLGTMLELGEGSALLHDRIFADALAREIDLIVATGAFAEAAARASGVTPGRIVASRDWRSAYPLLRERLRGREVLLLKASRGIAMEGMLPLLESDFGPDAGEEEVR